ncbi:MAG TPA: carbohydrate binding domain-containing protein, partial [Fibrobacteria bacterium]|nr:carbohydrate binding domain-containing protein [Fibrobacteria bacterium]
APTGVTASGFDYTLPATSATHFVVSTDAEVSLPSPDLVALNIEVIGQGQVIRSIRTALVPRGTVVKLTAVPAPDWTFGGWAQDASGKDTALSVTMDAARSVKATFLSSANLIVNGDFSNGTTGWTPSAWSPDGTAQGTAAVQNGGLVYTVTNGATETWNVQIFQTAVPFIKGTSYTLSFDAWASKARDIKVYANQGALSKTVTLGTASAGYTFTFVSDSTESGKLSFDIGGTGSNGTTVYLDNVSIKAAASGSRVASGRAKLPGLSQQGRQLVLNGEGTLVLCDTQGKVVLSRHIRSSGRVSVPSLPRGLYFATFQGAHSLVRILD